MEKINHEMDQEVTNAQYYFSEGYGNEYRKNEASHRKGERGKKMGVTNGGWRELL